jgi:hypothetical protein
MATHLVMYRGDDMAFPLTITQGGEPVDMTNATVMFTAREALDDASPLFTLTTTDDEIEIAADQTADKGLITVTVASGETTDLETPKTLLCDVEYVIDSVTRTWPEPDYGQGTLIKLKVRTDVTHE